MSEEEAEADWIKLRFAENGGEPVCPRCRCDAVYTIRRKRKRASGEVYTRTIFSCLDCEKQFSPTFGTIFQDRKLDYSHLLFAVALWVNGAKGLSALQLSRDVNVNYRTAFTLLHKLRESIVSMQSRLEFTGKVEADAAYYGGHVRKSRRRAHQRDRRKLANQSGKRKAVTVVRERNGRSRAFVMSELDWATGVTKSVIDRDADVFFDEAKAFDSLHGWFRNVHRIDHSKSYAEGEVSTNWVESSHSRMKRSQMGVYHNIAGPYLDAYLNELTWREDYRRVSNGDQFVTLMTLATHHPRSANFRGYGRRRRRAP